MSKIGLIAAAMVVPCASIVTAPSAHAQQRVFVSGKGNDANPCSLAAPCRTFQHAHDVTTSGGEIDVLDPAGYGAVAIAKSLSIQAHGFGGITQQSSSGFAVKISAGSADAVTLNGLLIDGAHTGLDGIDIRSAGAVHILGSVIRHFSVGIFYRPSNSPANLLIEDTIASDNINGISTEPSGTPTLTLNGVTANDNQTGVSIGIGRVMIVNTTISNNSVTGLYNQNPSIGGAATWLANTTISGNGAAGGTGAGGVNVGSGTLYSYGDNNINGNTAPDIAHGSLTTAAPQ